MEYSWKVSASTAVPVNPFLDLSSKFKWPEYAVFGAILFSSAAIGIFYGCFGSKQSTNEEFLMGNRKMAPLPVALSLLCRLVEPHDIILIKWNIFIPPVY